MEERKPSRWKCYNKSPELKEIFLYRSKKEII
jgi:hypothetical protein